MILGTDTGTNTITVVNKKQPVVPENGIDSARIKKMFNDVDSDMHFYHKMFEVYKAAAIAFKENMEAERRANKERSASLVKEGTTEEIGSQLFVQSID